MKAPRSLRLLVYVSALGVLLLAACAPAAAPTPEKAAPPAPAPKAAAPEPAKPAAPAPAPAAKPAAPAPAPAAKPAAPRVLRIAFGQEAESKDPYGHSTSTAYATWMHVMEPLVDWDWDKKQYAGVLAESWSNPDPTTWRFNLRKGVKFHDGTEFTSKDVLHSLNRIMNDPASKQSSGLKGAVEAVVAVDAYTVDLKTAKVQAPLLAHLISRVMTSKDAVDKGGPTADQALVGTGPYRFKEFIQGQRFVVTKAPTYWGKPAEPDEVVVRPIQESAARVTALLNDEVDIIDTVPPELLERVQSSANARVVSGPSLRNIFLGLNPIEGAEPLKDVRVRRAIYHAIDRKSLVDNLLRGQAQVLDGPISPDFLAYDPNLKPTYPYDPEKAKQLLAEAGYPNGFPLEVWTSVGRTNKDKETIEAVAGMLTKVGIAASVKTAEWGTYFGDYISNGKIPAYIINRGDQVDPNPYLHQYFRTGVSKRLRGFSDPKVDELLNKEAGIVEPQQRTAALRQAMSAIMEAAPAVFLYALTNDYGVSKKVDFTPRPDAYRYGQLVKFK